MMIALASLMKAAIQHDGRGMLVSTGCFGVVVAVSCYVSQERR